jgi:hypothetical protein
MGGFNSKENGLSSRSLYPDGTPTGDDSMDSDTIMGYFPELTEDLEAIAREPFSHSKQQLFTEYIQDLHLKLVKYRRHPSYAEKWEVIWKFKLYQHIVTSHTFYLQSIHFDGFFNSPPTTKPNDFAVFCAMVVKSRVLERLSLQRCKLTTEDLIAFSVVLTSPNATRLLQLNLSDNKLCGASVATLATALSNNHSLMDLILEKNLIDDDGARDLAEMLRLNKTMQKLSLDYNRIKTNGLRLLCRALLRNYWIRDFYIGWNLVDEEGAQFARECLLNSAVDQLQISGNPVSMFLS